MVDVSISKIFVRNFERPIMKGNLFVSNKIVTKHIGQHIVSFRKTDSNKILQLYFIPGLHLVSSETYVL